MPFVDLKNVRETEPVEGCHGRFVHPDSMTVASWTIDDGSVLSEHAHPHEQIACMLEGRFELTLDGETRIMEPGAMAVIPSNVQHSERAITECRILDVWHPSRDEFR
jgi:quercetin dioxygenase-like cupin family protein